jgi:hypothetical protein
MFKPMTNNVKIKKDWIETHEHRVARVQGQPWRRNSKVCSMPDTSISSEYVILDKRISALYEENNQIRIL